MIRIFPVLFLLTCLQAGAQPADDLRSHEDFFQQQSQPYQSWLKQTGLDQALTVYEVQVFEQGVLLNLQFTSPHPDTVAASWFAAKAAFEADNLLTLEEALFLKLLRLFDLQSTQAFLQIRSDYRGLLTEYYVKVYTEDGQLKTDQNFSKGYFDKIEISLSADAAPVSERELSAATRSKKEIYQLVQQFVEVQYPAKADCPEGEPVIDAFFSLNDKLLVSVSGLCREVLVEQDELLFCKVLRRLRQDCSSVKRETLHFEFDFDEKSRRLYCQLDGKYSNDYLLFHGKVQDMDDEFESFLQDYGDNFLKTLKTWIEQQ